MTATYEAIATTTLSSAAASVSFSTIPGTFTDLILVCRWDLANDNKNLLGKINGDTGSNYSWTYLEGISSSAGSGRGSNSTFLNLGYTFYGAQNTAIIHYMNYSNTTTYKTVINRQNSPASYVSATVNLWRSTSAITSISVDGNGTNFISGSSFTLYGIKAE